MKSAKNASQSHARRAGMLALQSMTGYSGTPLAKKLGFKPGYSVLTVNAPADYAGLVAPLPDGVVITSDLRSGVDLIHLFTNSRDELFGKLAECVRLIKQDGSIWVSWYKKAAKLRSDITEDTVREAAFPLGLVDVKVCSVDEKWSGLKLVIRKENRVSSPTAREGSHVPEAS